MRAKCKWSARTHTHTHTSFFGSTRPKCAEGWLIEGCEAVRAWPCQWPSPTPLQICSELASVPALRPGWFAHMQPKCLHRATFRPCAVLWSNAAVRHRFWFRCMESRALAIPTRGFGGTHHGVVHGSNFGLPPSESFPSPPAFLCSFRVKLGRVEHVLLLMRFSLVQLHVRPKQGRATGQTRRRRLVGTSPMKMMAANLVDESPEASRRKS